MSVKYACFLNKSEKWWLIKIFVLFAFRESLTVALSYLLAIFLIFKLHIFRICYETLALTMSYGIFGFEIDRKFSFNH